MGDWLLNAARRLNLQTAYILNAKFYPEEVNLRPLTMHAATLKEIIQKELATNGFAIDFIEKAQIDFEFPDPRYFRTTIYCYPYMIDKEGKWNRSKRIIGEGLEPDFDPFDEKNIYPSKSRARQFIESLRNLFK